MPVSSMPLALFMALCCAVPCADAAPVPDDEVHPTLHEIFQPPRLLGSRPTTLGMSADGLWITYQWAGEDAGEDAGENTKDPERDLYLASTDGTASEVFAEHDQGVKVLWTHSGSLLLREKDGWIDSIDIAGDRIPLPLFEGASLREVQLLEDERTAVLSAGDEHQIWVLDLLTGARHAPAASLKNRSRWYQVLEDRKTLALFAAPSSAVEPVEEGEEEAPRVLWLLTYGGDAPGVQETEVQEVGNARLSADGEWLSTYTRESTIERELVMADYLSEQVSVVPVRSSLAGDDTSLLDVRLFETSSNTEHPLPFDAQDRFHLLSHSWSPTAPLLLVDRLSNDYHVRQVMVVDARTQAMTVLLSERDDAWIGGPTTRAAWTKDGEQVVFTSERSGFNHLYRVQPNGEGEVALTSGEYEVQSVDILDKHGRALLVSNAASDLGVRQLRLLDLGTGEQAVLTGLDGCAASSRTWGDSPDRPRVSRDGSRLVYMWETLGQPGDLRSQPVAPGLPAGIATSEAPTRLTHFVPKALDALELVQPDIIEYANPDDGSIVRSFLYLPEPYDPIQRYPLVVFVHGAGYLQNVTRSRTSYEVDKLFHHRLARKGYVVLAPDFRHSAGYGRDFRADVYGYMGGKDTDDVVAGIKHLEQLGLIDPSRVGVYGGSYGGFLALMCLSRYPEMFSCAAALRSVTDWRTYHAGYTNPRLGHPERDAENYERSSPIDLVEAVQDPVLMLHGLIDDNVFAQDTIRYIERLIELGKPFDAMLYPSQAHGFTDPASWIDEYGRIEAYMDRYLKDD